MNFFEFLEIFYHMFFRGSVWVKFNFFIFLFINNQSTIELFAQDMIKSGKNFDPSIRSTWVPKQLSLKNN